MLSQQLSTSALIASLTTPRLYNLLQPITVPSYSSRSRFTNWGRTYTCVPLAIFEPETELQCALVLELARREGRRVRFSGIGHSPSDLACTREYMLRTTKMNKILEVGSPPLRALLSMIECLTASSLIRIGERREELRCCTGRDYP